MRIAILTFLILSSGVATALAQPNTQRLRPALPAPGQVRPTEPGQQITHDLLQFAAAINAARPFPRAQEYIYGARIGYFGTNEWLREMMVRKGGIGLKIENIAVDTITDRSANAKVTYSFDVPDDLEDGKVEEFLRQERNEEFQLKLAVSPFSAKEKIWQIVPPEKQPQILENGEGFYILSALNFALAQKQPLNLGDARANRSTFHLKLLALGVMQLTIDFDGRYAFAPQYLREAVSPYVGRDIGIFFVPGHNEVYTFNTYLSDLSDAQIAEHDRTVMLYEGEDEKPTFRYDGKAAIALADGHVKFVSPEEAKNLIWKP